MAKVVCPKYGEKFTGSPLKKTAAAAALGAAGAYAGSSIGIAAGPAGAIAGTIPGAVIGVTVGYLGAGKVYKCPKCDKVFLVD